jgi:hypothetical protein
MSFRFLKSFSLVISVAILVVFSSLNAFANERQEINRIFDVSPGGQLTLETDLGSVELTSGRENKVEVRVILEAKTGNRDRAEEIFDDFHIEFDQEGDDIYILAEYDDERGGLRFWDRKRSRLRVKYFITVPARYDASLQTSGGSITVGDLEGRVHVVSSGGSLSFENITGPVRGKTSGGSVELLSCAGTADIRTSGGSISIGRVDGDVAAHTSGGSISIEESLGSIDASTSGGSVMARLTRQPKDGCRLTTSGGNVAVYMAEDIAVDINAKTSGGRVKNDFPLKVRGCVSGTSLEAAINGGGPELYLRTSGGNIHLREL